MKHKFRIVEIISHNFWLKVLSFILAVATWFYVFDVVYPVASQQKREALEEVLERYNFTLKEVPVRAVLTGTAPEGYRVVFDKVKVEPSVIAIYGPEELIDKSAFEIIHPDDLQLVRRLPAGRDHPLDWADAGSDGDRYGGLQVPDAPGPDDGD